MINTINQKPNGFTLIELMIVVAIIGILAAIAYPSYQRYIIKTKRTDMMSEMHNIAAEIQSRKLAQGSFANVVTTDLTGNYPRQGTALYTVAAAPSPLTNTWTITAEPKSSTQMNGDGNLTLNYQGVKCRIVNSVSTCGTGDDWNN
ncbi:possible pilus assembly protein PilE [Psychrobacter arcticus 273-4]|uniref:Possible pilus assembly protein PilE n=1 Tax=Psychrobacter arcticus (strain DSM 17307 / VKM B-2377 / 273-4) TaxID=259536 RepID=Q4FV48_PSYA2|nr:type IV pilin protein [Psychrobacter arcticus]AAZ18110.1 possible pilus assembly protein PilE [Psychrobacter arcticus 273-4]